MSDVIEEAKAPGVFKLEDMLSGIAYPVEEVVVFTDAYSANELAKLRMERTALEKKIADNKKVRTQRTVNGDSAGTPVQEDVEKLSEKIEPLDEKVTQSAITITFRGMSPKAVQAITDKHFTDKTKDYSNTAEEEERDYELIASSIVGMKDANGNSDSSSVTVDTVKMLRGSILAGEYSRLIVATSRVNMNSALFDQATDASFLSRRINLAG